MKKLRGKNCLLTGAASGIGRALALLLAKEGMNLYIVDIDTEKLEDVKREIEQIGAKVFADRCDVSKLEDLQKIEKDFSQKLGDLDLLINNAGAAGGGFILDIPLDEWEKVLGVNIWSIIYAIKVFLPKMIERGSGHFISTGSGAGIVGLAFHPHYVASKFAISGITEALYSELNGSGVNFSVICPTRVYTSIGRNSPINLTPNLLTEKDPAEIENKMAKFRDVFDVEFYKGGVQPEDAAKRYLKGIKKNKLYIFDIKILRLALFIKAVALRRGWKAILRKTAREDFEALETCLVDSGLSTKEHLKKELGNLIE